MEEQTLSPATPGSSLGKFRIISILGRSRMGILYEAEDTQFHRRVALRHLPADVADNSSAIDRLTATAQTALGLSHPNVAALYEVGRFEDGTAYLATEFVGGGSAADKLAILGRLPWRDATRIVTGACRGLKAAHEAGVSHGAIRPTNLLVAHDGTVKLADFDFVQVEGPADARGDIYALGATYFTLLTGRPPFDTGATGRPGSGDRPVPNVRASFPTIPLRCDAIIRKAMAHNPAERYPTAAATLADLEMALAAEDVAAPALPPASLLQPPRTPLWKRLATWFGGASVVAIVLASAYFAMSLHDRAGANSTGTASQAQFAPATALSTITNSIGMVLAHVPAGSFTMGDMFIANARPPHPVRISRPFLIGVHEVTQEQYQLVTGANPSAVQGDRQPVEQVTWEEAVAFCELLSELDAERSAGRVYRLPTEAEWEYCCRAGTIDSFAFGPTLSFLQANILASGMDGTTPVGTYPPNAWGLFDMHGNVAEWCADWFGFDYYEKSPDIDPTGPENGTKRVVRGGAWFSSTADCRSGHRYGTFTPDSRNPGVGFRVVCIEPDKK